MPAQKHLTNRTAMGINQAGTLIARLGSFGKKKLAGNLQTVRGIHDHELWNDQFFHRIFRGECFRRDHINLPTFCRDRGDGRGMDSCGIQKSHFFS